MERLHLSSCERYLWRARGALAVRGCFSEARVSRDLYEARHGIRAAEGPAALELDRAMAAIALGGVALVDRESWGLSITLPGRDFGLFVGFEPEGMICGRPGPAKRDGALVAVQRRKAGGPLIQSSYQPPGADVVAAVEEYYRRVEQIPTRLVVTADFEGALVQALPGGGIAEAAGLGAEGLVSLVDRGIAAGELEPVQEVLVFYECRCDEELIRGMISAVPEAARADLFGGEAELSVECPRCGREYVVRGAQ